MLLEWKFQADRKIESPSSMAEISREGGSRAAIVLTSGISVRMQLRIEDDAVTAAGEGLDAPGDGIAAEQHV